MLFLCNRLSAFPFLDSVSAQFFSFCIGAKIFVSNVAPLYIGAIFQFRICAIFTSATANCIGAFFS